MRTDDEIIDIIYGIVRDSGLMDEVGGQLRRGARPSDSDAEDVVVAVVANENGERQTAYVNVNIYVPDTFRDDEHVIDSARTRKLSRGIADLLELNFGDGWRATIDSQRVLAVEDKDEHMINTKLLFEQNNN